MWIQFSLILVYITLLSGCAPQVERKAVVTAVPAPTIATVPTARSNSPGARKALVIGNGAYSRWERGVNAFGPLTNPKYDAIDMAVRLDSYGFDVAKVIDGNAKTLFRAINQFAASLGPTDVALLYYSGHGVTTVCNPTSGESHNYFVPVGRVIWDYADLCDTSVASPISAQWALRKLETRGNKGVNILIFDACREVIEVSLQTKGRGFERKGFTEMHSNGSFIAYAAAPGQSSWGNPQGRNSVYTAQLLQTLKPGQDDLPIPLLFQQLHVPVAEAAKRQYAAAVQDPWENNGLKGNFCFRAPCRSLTGPRISQVDLKKEQQARQQAEAEKRRLAAENAKLQEQVRQAQQAKNDAVLNRLLQAEENAEKRRLAAENAFNEAKIRTQIAKSIRANFGRYSASDPLKVYVMPFMSSDRFTDSEIGRIAWVGAMDGIRDIASFSAGRMKLVYYNSSRKAFENDLQRDSFWRDMRSGSNIKSILKGTVNRKGSNALIYGLYDGDDYGLEITVYFYFKYDYLILKTRDRIKTTWDVVMGLSRNKKAGGRLTYRQKALQRKIHAKMTLAIVSLLRKYMEAREFKAWGIK